MKNKEAGWYGMYPDCNYPQGSFAPGTDAFCTNVDCGAEHISERKNWYEVGEEIDPNLVLWRSYEGEDRAGPDGDGGWTFQGNFFYTF
jgi:hypothetical protein